MKPAPALAAAQIESAAEAMEGGDYAGAVGLLVNLLSELGGLGSEPMEATARLLLAQSLASLDDMTGAQAQAAHALRIAERLDDRDLSHRCLALVESLRRM
jgi:hypothetical protein